MLLTHRNRRSELSNALASVHNYYEHLVIEQLQEALVNRECSNDFLADVACVALNHLPSRYIRHNVDMAFYLPSNKRLEMITEVEKAVSDAIAFVDKNDHVKQ